MSTTLHPHINLSTIIETDKYTILGTSRTACSCSVEHLAPAATGSGRALSGETERKLHATGIAVMNFHNILNIKK
jgi:hypothetical protein